MWQGLVCSNVWFKNTETHHPIWVRPDAGAVWALSGLQQGLNGLANRSRQDTRQYRICGEGAVRSSRPAMLEGIAKALTRRLLQDHPGIGVRGGFGQVPQFT
jgi:hypothetical protein